MPRTKSSKRAAADAPPVILSRFPGQLRSEQLREYLVRQLAGLSAGDKLPSERELARESGLSLLTVNKVLATLAAEGLVERRTGRGTFVSHSRPAAERGLKMLRFVVRHPEETLTRPNQYYSQLYYRGVREAAAADEIEILPTAFDSVNGVDALPADAFDSPNIEGLFFVEGGAPDYRRLWRFLEEGRRIVAFDYAAPERGLNSVVFDNIGGMKIAVEHLLAHGHRRIAYVGLSDNVSQPADERLLGYKQAMMAAGIDPNQLTVILGRGQVLVEKVRDAMLQAADVRPTAFTGFMDHNLLDAYDGIRAAGLRVPEDVSLSGFGDALIRETLSPIKIDSVAFDETQMGRMAYTLWKSGAKGLVKRQTGTLIVRGSVRRIEP